MASIRKRGSNSYLIVVSRGYDYEGNRLKSVQKTVKPPKEYTPKQAEKWVKEQAILFEREVQHTPEPINRSITLAKYIEHWVTDVGPKKLADSTFRRDEQDIRRILPALGNYKLTDLRKEVIRDFYEEMRHSPRLDGRGNLSEKSVEGLHNTLCGILSAAVDEGYLTHNPAWRCYKPKGQKKERPVADEETVKKLITAFEGQSMKYETYFKLVLATGLRRGEACGLRWSDINWRKRTIHVQRGVVKLSHQESITKDPKTSSGDRMVYLSKEMCQLLKAWRKECEWDRAQTANETVSEDDYLFRQPNGKPMCPSTFTYRFKLILNANNLPLDLSVHSLRHTNASLLIAQGVDVRTVASLLGHAQASTTLDIYAHAFDKNKRNPHFLYNTLECIRSEAILQDCENIARMSHALASFFRYSISRKENIVTLRDELSNIKNYFFIQQFRFEDRFFLDIQVEDGDDELLDCLLPKMTLQPIVENCVFHGLEPKAEQGHVTIRISGTKDMMKVIVEDDGVGMPPDVLDKMRAALEEERQPTNQPDTHGNGIAMYNVNQRIKLAFGRDYGLFVYSTENLGTDVEIWMPKVYTKEELLMQ